MPQLGSLWSWTFAPQTSKRFPSRHDIRTVSAFRQRDFPPSLRPMAEAPIWTGRSSQLKNLGPFLLCLLVIPIPWAIWRYLVVRCRVYQLSNERLLITSGVINKVTETLELYRVRDLQSAQPLLLRFFNLQNLHLITSDSSTPEVIIDYVPAGAGLNELFREHIEKCRVQKRVREIDIE